MAHASSHETGLTLPAIYYTPHGVAQPLPEFKITTLDENYMQRAVDLAEMALRAGDYPVGAVIVDTYGDTYEGYADEFATKRLAGHAEQNAIAQYNKITGKHTLEGTMIYVTQSPCVGCSYQIDQGHVSILYEAATRSDCNKATEQEFGKPIVRPRELDFENVFNDSSRDITVVSGLLRAESIKLFLEKAREKYT